jgi:hypothetical protein
MRRVLEGSSQATIHRPVPKIAVRASRQCEPAVAPRLPSAFPIRSRSSARGQRVAILSIPLHELTGFYPAVDCLTAGYGGERTYADKAPNRRAHQGSKMRSASTARWCVANPSSRVGLFAL